MTALAACPKCGVGDVRPNYPRPNYKTFNRPSVVLGLQNIRIYSVTHLPIQSFELGERDFSLDLYERVKLGQQVAGTPLFRHSALLALRSRPIASCTYTATTTSLPTTNWTEIARIASSAKGRPHGELGGGRLSKPGIVYDRIEHARPGPIHRRFTKC